MSENNRYKFPEGFLWGSAIAAHQVEGNNSNNDWWEAENNRPEDRLYPKEPSGIAADSYNRFEEDFELAKGMNNNAIRLSIEWSRLEPEEGRFDDSEFEHYRKVLKAAKDRGLQTFVTLHHFTNPIWLKDKGQWENRETPKLFARYAMKCAEELGDYIDVFLTINEPQVYTLMGYLAGRWPPFKERNPIWAFLVQVNFMRGHRRAYKAIKSVNKEYQVGIVKNITNFEEYPNKSTLLDKIAMFFMNFANRHLLFLQALGRLDAIGINYYFTNRMVHFRQHNPSDYVSDLGWWINPGGIEPILTSISKYYKVPIYVTENGLADSQDKYRQQFIRDHLLSIHTAIQKGADVRGYFHWSLIDNYEWAEGYWPRFGLIEIDRDNNLERKPRDSYYYYGEIAKNNEVKIEGESY